jgi:hypothetical protein
MSELLPKLLSLGIRPLFTLCFARSLRLRLDERLRKRIDLRRKQRESSSKVRLRHELQLFGLRRDSPAVVKRQPFVIRAQLELVIDL